MCHSGYVTKFHWHTLSDTFSLVTQLFSAKNCVTQGMSTVYHKGKIITKKCCLQLRIDLLNHACFFINFQCKYFRVTCCLNPNQGKEDIAYRSFTMTQKSLFQALQKLANNLIRRMSKIYVKRTKFVGHRCLDVFKCL